MATKTASKKKTTRKSKPVGKKVRKIGTEHFDFYQKLTRDINIWLNKKVGKNHKWAEYIMLVPNLFHLLIKLVIDPKVPLAEKGELGIAIAYFIAPIDFIPEGIIGPAGYVDDIAFTCYVLNSIINKTGPEIVEKHWQEKRIF